MKKLVSTLITIIFFQTQIFSFPTQPISVLLPINNSVINNSVSLPCLSPADSSSSVIPAEQLGGNLSETKTKQSFSKLNRDISNTQELTKDQTTRALNIDTTIDLRWLSGEGRKDIWNDIKKAPKNTKKATKNLIKDIKTTIAKTEEIIKQTITKQTKDELTKNVDKIEFSKNKQENKKVKDKILQSEEVAKLQIAIDNIKILEEYLKNNNLDSQTVEKLKELGATGEYSYVIGNNGELLVSGYKYESKVIDDNNIQMTLTTIEALDERYLKQESKGTYKDVLTETISDATTSIQIAVGSSKELYKIGKDTNEVIEDTKELIKEIAKSSKDENTYEIAKETIKEIPNSIKETYYATVNVSNIENLQALGYKIGNKIYEYKENPISLLEDTASLLTSYDLYKTGLTEENIIYATGLIVGGLALDVSGTPLKAGKTITTTAKEIKVAEKLVDTTKTSLTGTAEIKSLRQLMNVDDVINYNEYWKNVGLAIEKESLEIQKIYNTWPSNNGFYAEFTKPEPLKVGTIVDKIGVDYEKGAFLAPVGIPFELRALPTYYKTDIKYKTFEYKVLKEFTPESGVINSGFGYPGGGIQYYLKNIKIIDNEIGVFRNVNTEQPIKDLIDNKYLREID